MNEYPKKIVAKCLEDPLDAAVERSRCPKCEGLDTDLLHHTATFALPECHYRCCNECEHQWDHS